LIAFSSVSLLMCLLNEVEVAGISLLEFLMVATIVFNQYGVGPVVHLDFTEDINAIGLLRNSKHLGDPDLIVAAKEAILERQQEMANKDASTGIKTFVRFGVSPQGIKEVFTAPSKITSFELISQFVHWVKNKRINNGLRTGGADLEIKDVSVQGDIVHGTTQHATLPGYCQRIAMRLEDVVPAQMYPPKANPALRRIAETMDLKRRKEACTEERMREAAKTKPSQVYRGVGCASTFGVTQKFFFPYLLALLCLVTFCGATRAGKNQIYGPHNAIPVVYPTSNFPSAGDSSQWCSANFKYKQFTLLTDSNACPTESVFEPRRPIFDHRCPAPVEELTVIVLKEIRSFLAKVAEGGFTVYTAASSGFFGVLQALYVWILCRDCSWGLIGLRILVLALLIFYSSLWLFALGVALFGKTLLRLTSSWGDARARITGLIGRFLHFILPGLIYAWLYAPQVNTTAKSVVTDPSGTLAALTHLQQDVSKPTAESLLANSTLIPVSAVPASMVTISLPINGNYVPDGAGSRIKWRKKTGLLLTMHQVKGIRSTVPKDGKILLVNFRTNGTVEVPISEITTAIHCENAGLAVVCFHERYWSTLGVTAASIAPQKHVDRQYSFFQRLQNQTFLQMTKLTPIPGTISGRKHSASTLPSMSGTPFYTPDGKTIVAIHLAGGPRSIHGLATWNGGSVVNGLCLIASRNKSAAETLDAWDPISRWEDYDRDDRADYAEAHADAKAREAEALEEFVDFESNQINTAVLRDEQLEDEEGNGEEFRSRIRVSVWDTALKGRSWADDEDFAGVDEWYENFGDGESLNLPRPRKGAKARLPSSTISETTSGTNRKPSSRRATASTTLVVPSSASPDQNKPNNQTSQSTSSSLSQASKPGTSGPMPGPLEEPKQKDVPSNTRPESSSQPLTLAELNLIKLEMEESKKTMAQFLEQQQRILKDCAEVSSKLQTSSAHAESSASSELLKDLSLTLKDLLLEKKQKEPETPEETKVQEVKAHQVVDPKAKKEKDKVKTPLQIQKQKEKRKRQAAAKKEKKEVKKKPDSATTPATESSSQISGTQLLSALVAISKAAEAASSQQTASSKAEPTAKTS
jgi:hypothetical protein